MNMNQTNSTGRGSLDEDFFDVVLRSLIAVGKAVGIMIGFVFLGTIVTSVLPMFGSILDTIILDLIVAGIVCWIRKYQPRWVAFGDKQPKALAVSMRDARVRWSLAALVPAFVAGQALGAVIARRMPAGVTTHVDPSTSAQWVFWILFSVGIAPVCEEALLRGLLYPMIRRHDRARPFLATVITTVLFAGLHANGIQFVTVIPLSVLACMAYERTQRLWLPVVLHACFNAAAVVLPASSTNWLSRTPVVVLSLAATAVMLWLLSVYGVADRVDDQRTTNRLVSGIPVLPALRAAKRPGTRHDSIAQPSADGDGDQAAPTNLASSGPRGLLTDGHVRPAPGVGPSEPENEDPFEPYSSYDPYR